MSVAEDRTLCGCLLELDSRKKVEEVSQPYHIVVGTVEVRFHTISLVPGFQWEEGSSATQSDDPGFLIVAAKEDPSLNCRPDVHLNLPSPTSCPPTSCPPI